MALFVHYALLGEHVGKRFICLSPASVCPTQPLPKHLPGHPYLVLPNSNESRMPASFWLYLASTMSLTEAKDMSATGDTDQYA